MDIRHFVPHWQIVAAWIIFLTSYLVFAIGRLPGTRIDRPAMAVVGAALMFVFRILSPRSAIASIDSSTLVLLFSMMLIVASVHLAGFFAWTTDRIILHLSSRQLLPGIVFTRGILSAFLVNDVVCLVLAPLVLDVCKRMGVRPLPYLLALATASNVGSVATVTGNPQNILIGSISAISYRDFLIHLAPVALIGLVIDCAILYCMYLRSEPEEPFTSLNARAETSSFESRKLSLLWPVAVSAGVLTGFLCGANRPCGSGWWSTAVGAPDLRSARDLRRRGLVAARLVSWPVFNPWRGRTGRSYG